MVRHLSRMIPAILVTSMLFTAPIACTKPPPYRPLGVDTTLNYHYFRVVAASFIPNQHQILIKYLDYGLGHTDGIYRIDYNGKVIECICARWKNNYCWGPTISPNGKEFAYGIGNRTTGSDIYLGSLQTRKVQRLTKDSFLENYWVFSQDNNRLYFVRFRDMLPGSKSKEYPFYNGDIYCINIFTKKESSVALGQYGKIYYFSIFPDEKHYLVSTDKYKEDGHLLWKVDINDPIKRVAIAPDLTPFTKEPRASDRILKRFSRKAIESNIEGYSTHKTEWEFVDVLFLDIRWPVLSRDGKWLIFSWSVPKTYRDNLFVTNLATMETIKIDSPPKRIIPLAISPNNRQILFSSYKDKLTKHGYQRTTNLWIINRDGTNLKNINPDFSQLNKPTKY